MTEGTKAILGILMIQALIGLATWLTIWRIDTFAHATGMPFWKAFFVLGR